MPPTRPEPDPDPDDGVGWEPEPPWEPEPEPTPWSELEAEADRERRRQQPPRGREPAPGRPDAVPGYGAAYLAAGAVVVAVFGLGLITAGLQARGVPAAKPITAAGAAATALGLGLLALAAWLAGRSERRP